MTDNSPNTSDPNQPSSLPWYAGGLNFECSGCGGCCIGDPGYVWVNKEEIAALAELLDMTKGEFKRAYARKEHGRRSLRERKNGDCVFFDRKIMGCTVYKARPVQCRTWPFWQSNLKSPGTWEYTCNECPGAGEGPLVPLDEIEQQRIQKRV